MSGRRRVDGAGSVEGNEARRRKRRGLGRVKCEGEDCSVSVESTMHVGGDRNPCAIECSATPDEIAGPLATGTQSSARPLGDGEWLALPWARSCERRSPKRSHRERSVPYRATCSSLSDGAESSVRGGVGGAVADGSTGKRNAHGRGMWCTLAGAPSSWRRAWMVSPAPAIARPAGR